MGDSSLLRKITAFTENAVKKKKKQVKHWSLLVISNVVVRVVVVHSPDLVLAL